MKKLFTLIALCLGMTSSAWADTKNFDVDLSKFDNGLTYDAESKVASITLGNKAWSKLDLKEYFDQIDGNITNVKITLTENIGDDGSRMALGLYDYNKSSWAANAYQDTEKSVTVWGVMGRDNATRIYYNTTYLGSGITVGSDAVIEIDMNLSTKKFTLKDNGTTRINGQNLVDTNIELIRWFALYSWATNTTTIKNMSMEVTYSAAKRSVTFNETNSCEYTLVVKDAVGNTIDAESDGSYNLLQGKTYSYTATPEDILEYRVINDSFTVGSEDMDVSFTFANVTLPQYSLPTNALYGKATVPAGTKQITGISRAGYTTTGVGGPMNNSYTWTIGEGFTWHASFDVYRADESASVNMKMYTNKGAESTSFQFDNQGVKYWTSSTTAYISNTALTPGKWYRVEIVSDLTANLTVGGNTMSVTITDIDSDTQFATKSGIGFRNGNAQWFLPTNDQVIKTILTNWYSYYVADDATCDITGAGYATFSSPYALNLDGMTEGYTAYQATAIGGETVTIESVSGTVAANTGLIIKGDAGTCTIPVVAEGTDISATNKFVAVTADNTVVPAGAYVLGIDNDEVKFLLTSAEHQATLGAGKSYLAAPAGASARLRMVIKGETTGIQNVNVANAKQNVIYNLAGQRVNANAKGIVLVNGKKVIK